MRIISGRLRGKKITAPDSLPVRPTTDFAKTGLFNILSNHLSFSTIAALDLYCGTGNISYELISRGAKSVTAVDSDKRCVAFVQKTFNDIHAENAKAKQSDALDFLEQCSRPFDLIFANPPFNLNPVQEIAEIVYRKKLLTAQGLLVIEHCSEMQAPKSDNLLETRTYGAVAFSIFVAEK